MLENGSILSAGIVKFAIVYIKEILLFSATIQVKKQPIRSLFLTPWGAGAFVFRENSLKWVHKEYFPPTTQSPIHWRRPQKVVKWSVSMIFSDPHTFQTLIVAPLKLSFFFPSCLRIAAKSRIETNTVRRTAHCGFEAFLWDFLDRQRHFLINEMSWQTDLPCTKETSTWSGPWWGDFTLLNPH